jgi:nitrogen regulatory protein P-II 2
MKLIIAFVKPYKLDNVRDAMEGVGVDSFSFAEVRGIGHHKGERDIYRGVEYAPSYVPMMQILVAAKEDVVEDLMNAIAKAARTDRRQSEARASCPFLGLRARPRRRRAIRRRTYRAHPRTWRISAELTELRR